MTVSTSRDTDASADIEAKSETRTEITVTMPATLYLNPSIDTLAPRGFWNIISFSDFCSRISSLGLHTIAIDASGCFWRENLKDYCRRRCWVLNGVREVLIYDSMGVGELKGSEYLERFRERVVEKRELSFVELEEEVDGVEGEGESEQVRKVRDVERFLGKVFDVIESEGDVEGDEEFGDVRKAEFVSMEPTEKSEFRRPVVRLVRLVTEAAG
ncbi:hypothetical protein DL98DRAFT_521146 [Cadophora sp. DSE1049]|nr:hypothetical protein DL98DRAFT_521146 [Cadophora sp. DSE1049]